MRVSRIIGAAALAVALIVGTPAAASATMALPAASGVPTADSDFVPSPNRWRGFMLNILGSVLGGAMPKGWRAEQIANQYRYNHSWDLFAAQHGYSANSRNALGEMMPIPKPGEGTYDDYVIAEYEKQMKKGGTGGKPMAAPATKPVKLLKTVGGALTAVFAFDIGTMLGSAGTNLVGGWFGFDAQGVVCGQTNDGSILSGVLRYASGQDCAMWDFDNAYVPNMDADGPLLVSAFGLWDLAYVGTYNGGALFCYAAPNYGTLPKAGYELHQQAESGVWVGVAMGVGSQPGTLCGGAAMYNLSSTSGGAGALTPVLRFTRLSDGETATMEQEAVDPDRQMDCTVTYTDATTATASGPTYRESTGVKPVTCPSTPDGKTPESVSIGERQVGGGPSTELANEEVTPEYADWWETYPECRTGACKLDLIRLTDPAVSCFDLEDGCVDWHTDPNKSTLYLCRYGVHDVALDECNVYAGLFQPGRVTVGAPYSDPLSGVWSGGQTSPAAGEKVMGATIQNPELMRGCDLSDLGFDPIGWVVRPVQCALEWAFVPRETVVAASFAGANEGWESKPPAVMADAVQALTPAASGCSRSVTLFDTTFNVIDACDGPMAGVAAVSRLVTSATMVVLVLVVLRRQIAAMVGYNQGQG